jgi:putative N6-adenine-specific DNA methylase
MYYKCFAACAFGLEGLAADELKSIGCENVAAADARVYFEADDAMLARANLWLRTADRVYIELAAFEARTFEELFTGVKSAGWADILPRDAKFPVAADSVQSVLKSVPDIQSISKKAIVEKLKTRYRQETFPETGREYPLYVLLHKDRASVALNTSGQGLNRRGYRTSTAAAPLRETLAAGLVTLSRYRGSETFIDPMCGSGTIAIEAAMKAMNIAPGLNRGFAFEAWGSGQKTAADAARREAKAAIREAEADILASDIDEDALKLARIHIKKAGLEGRIALKRADAGKLDLRDAKGVLVTNPPYAVRMGQANEVHTLYGRMGEAFLQKGLKLYILSADDEFERYFKKRADKKRKLYNGNIRCTLYQYFR